ncbi:hypothetical protein ACROYT_G017631 [Oculina patagonica]
MKGRSSGCEATVINRSRSAVSLDVNQNTRRFQKRKAKEPWMSEKLKENAVIGYKRISDHSDNLADAKKRRKTFNVISRKSPVDDHNLPKRRRSNITAGNPKTQKDKTLSMRERLELWRAEKGKGNPVKPAVKSKMVMKKLNRMPSGMKENVHHYRKLENIELQCTPASTKAVLQSQAKSTIKKTAYVTPTHPSHEKPSIVQPKSVLRLNIDRVNEADFNYPEARSQKNKTLDMRERLELWLAEKGKTPKYKTPSVLKYSRSAQRRNLTEEKKRLSFDCCGTETDSAMTERVRAISPGEGENIEQKLQECLLQLEKGECDPEKIAAKLDLYNSSCSHTSQIANYWLCRARIAQQEKDFDRVVCLLEQAFVFKAQPESVLKDAVCAFVTFMKENGQQDADTDEASHLPVSPANETKIDMNDSGLEELTSSVIKFCLTEATPYRKKFKATFGKPVLTPVRRSVRLERASVQHPSVVQEHGLTVRTLGELPEGIQQNVLFKPNFAVRAELNEAWNELQMDFNQ